MQDPMDPLVAEILRTLSYALQEEFEERAAIIEFEGKTSRAHAEALALLNVLRNHPEALKPKAQR